MIFNIPFIEDFPLWIQSLTNGFVGGLIYVLIQKMGWNDLANIERKLIMGILIGYITHVTGHLDAITTIVSGYIGIDSIEGLINHGKQDIKTKIQQEKLQ